MPTIRNLSAEVIEVPLRHVFASAKDILARPVSNPVVITVELDNGITAYGESVPVTYVTGETRESVLLAVGTARPLLLGADILRMRPLLDRLAAALPESPTARAGIEMALYSAYSAVTGISLWSLWGGAVDSVETDITLSIVPDAVDRAVEWAGRGFHIFKMKIGSGDMDADLRRVLAVRDAVPHARFRLDANQAFTAEEAVRLIHRVVDKGVSLELVEQPVDKDDLQSLDRVAAASPVPIFADEAVRSPADALRLVRETGVQGINIKLMKAGFSEALEIIAIARAAGRKLMIGCMLETRRGIYHSLALACGTGAFDFIDLDGHLLLNEEGENPYFSQEGSLLKISGADGTTG